jgi:ribosome-binding factor A
MSSSRRTQRMSSLIRAELARILVEEIADPALSGLSITEVELSGDFKHAKVFFHPPERKISEKEIGKGLQRAMPFFKKKLGDNLQLRYIPALEFSHDTHAATVARVFSLLETVHRPDGEPSPEGGEETSS